MLWQETEGGEHEEAWERLRSAHGILVPGGFGSRGVEGKILAAQYAREHSIPYLGICLGMQVPCATPSPFLLTLIAAEYQALQVEELSRLSAAQGGKLKLVDGCWRHAALLRAPRVLICHGQ